MTDKKIKVLTLGDMPLLASGVAIQTKYMIEGLLESGKFDVLSLGGAIKHGNYEAIRAHENWVVQPVDGYGDRNIINDVIRQWKPDILWFMTDPRFYEWLWMMEDEIRKHIPMVYYHVWDNYPYPLFNKKFYDANDCIVSISKLTSDIVRTVSPDVKESYIPHAVDPTVFKIRDKSESESLIKGNPVLKDKFICFWNNRNARRKQSGTLVKWWKEFTELEGVDASKVCLIMHTDPSDENGQPLTQLASDFELPPGSFSLSTDKLPAEALAAFYNLADCTINIADAEGFGLSTLESLYCGTPIIATVTGGLQEQITDGETNFGFPLYPASSVLIGSQSVPYIYEDRVSSKDFLDAVYKMYKMSPEERQELGHKGRQHALKNYAFDDYQKKWVLLLEDVHQTFGSYETRKNYKSWDLQTL